MSAPLEPPAAAGRGEERAAQLFTVGLDPVIAQKQVESAVAHRRNVEKDLSAAEQVLASISRRDVEERAYETLTTLKERIHEMSFDEKREILRILVPGTQEYRIELSADGAVTIKGAIDLAKASTPATRYSVTGYTPSPRTAHLSGFPIWFKFKVS